MQFKIVIPTFQRSQTLIEKTLATLRKTNVDFGSIYLFVASLQEKEAYEKAITDIPKDRIIVGRRGIPNQRNFIQDCFSEGEQLVFIDDDIEGIYYMDGDRKIKGLHNLTGLIEKAFFIAGMHEVKMWGLNSSPNPLSMARSYSLGHIYIVGNFYGLINTHDKRTYVDEGELIKSRADFKAGKESHERAIKHYLTYGGVIKFRGISVKSTYWKGEGGHQVSRTAEGEKDATTVLCKMYGNLVKERIMGGMPDIEFRTRTETYPFKWEG